MPVVVARAILASAPGAARATPTDAGSRCIFPLAPFFKALRFQAAA